MNRRNLLKTLILAPLAKLLPKIKPDKDLFEIPDDAFSDWTFACDTAANNTAFYTVYEFDSEGKAL